jgi:predicted nucleic acid-binding protein
MKGDVKDAQYQSLSRTDPKDLFLLDLALYINASYLITRDYRLLESMGGAKNMPIMYYTTLIINQGLFARSIMEVDKI